MSASATARKYSINMNQATELEAYLEAAHDSATYDEANSEEWEHGIIIKWMVARGLKKGEAVERAALKETREWVSNVE